MNWGEDALAEGRLRDLTGRTLGDFQVERLLGKGGMGEVYNARQISLNRQVALKVLRPALLSNETYLKRFESEATAVAKLNHPNIVHVYTLGCTDGIRFIAMEYVPGSNLRDYLQKKGALDLPIALSIMRQAGLAVGAAGDVGLVHRDIKPENILLTKKGQVKITDFGLCRDQDAAAMNLTQTGVTMGTPLYMSPEQAQGHATDHRGDLYSLGVTFYHMLAGQPPFRGDSPIAIALKHVKDEPVSLSVHRPDLPAELVKLVMRLIAKDPNHRYQTAAEMLRDLARVKETLHLPSQAIPAAELSAPSVAATALTRHASAPPLAPSTATELGTRRPRVGTSALSWLVAACLVAGAGVGWAGRPVDLLAEGAKSTAEAPALWIVPGWEQMVPKQNSAEEQYHYAQVRAGREEQEAAWIAVPGYFPRSFEWSSRAYTQLARTLLRRQDEDRLKVFAHELAAWNKTKTHEQELADIIQTGVQAFDGDLDGLIIEYNQKLLPHSLTDPALLELSIEVTNQALKEGLRTGANSVAHSRIREIQTKLIAELFQAQVDARRPSAPAGKPN